MYKTIQPILEPQVVLKFTTITLKIYNFSLFFSYGLRSDIHCQYCKSIAYVTCTVDFQYWQ